MIKYNETKLNKSDSNNNNNDSEMKYENETENQHSKHNHRDNHHSHPRYQPSNNGNQQNIHKLTYIHIFFQTKLTYFPFFCFFLFFFCFFLNGNQFLFCDTFFKNKNEICDFVKTKNEIP